MEATDDFKTRLEALLPELIAFRRDLHAHPEVGFEERRTAGRSRAPKAVACASATKS